MASPEQSLTPQFSDVPPRESPLYLGDETVADDPAWVLLPPVDYIPPTEGTPDVRHDDRAPTQDEAAHEEWF